MTPSAFLARRRPSALLAAAALVAAWAACSGCPESAEPGPDAKPDRLIQDASVPDADAAPMDSALPDTAPVDAQVVTYDFCDQAFFEIPIDTSVERVGGLTLSDHHLAYNKTGNGIGDHVYLFDLEACTQRMVFAAKAQSGSLWNDLFVYRPMIQGASPQTTNGDLRALDLATGNARWLTDDDYAEWGPVTNGSQVLYEVVEVHPDISDPPDDLGIFLMDLATGQTRMLVEPKLLSPYYDISDRYATWSAWVDDGSPGIARDIYYMDLATNQVGRVANSAPYFTYFTKTSGDWIVYEASENYIADPWHLFAYDVATGEDLTLSEDDPARPVGFIHDNLVTWSTAKYCGATSPWPSDIALFDLDTRIQRRVTTSESRLRVDGIWFPYMVVINDLGERHHYELYIIHMVRAGLTDDEGHLIPGDPVIDPPS